MMPIAAYLPAVYGLVFLNRIPMTVPDLLPNHLHRYKDGRQVVSGQFCVHQLFVCSGSGSSAAPGASGRDRVVRAAAGGIYRSAERNGRRCICPHQVLLHQGDLILLFWTGRGNWYTA